MAFVQTLYNLLLHFKSCLIIRPRYLASTNDWMTMVDVRKFDQVYISNDRPTWHVLVEKESILR